MLTTIYSLYNDLTQEIKDSYSKQKYGDEMLIEYYSKELSALIALNNINTEKAVIFVGRRKPYASEYKKNFVIIAEKIAQLTGLPIVYGYHNRAYSPKSFYDNQMKRKAGVPYLPKKDKERYMGYTFIGIEDSVITGTTVKVIEKALSNTAYELIILSILDLRGIEDDEKLLNDYFFDRYGLEGLIRIFKQKDYIPTTQMLRTLEKLNKEELDQLIKDIPQGLSILDIYKKYAGKELN